MVAFFFLVKSQQWNRVALHRLLYEQRYCSPLFHIRTGEAEKDSGSSSDRAQPERKHEAPAAQSVNTPTGSAGNPLPLIITQHLIVFFVAQLDEHISLVLI